MPLFVALFVLLGLLTVVPAQAQPAKPVADDMAWTTRGDAGGLHLLAATAPGYTWRTVATLSEPWIETDQWVGNACVTESGRRAVVVYAPRHFTNRGHLFDRGAFAATVDIATGTVRKLNVNVSLAYYNPGCGTGENAVLTQSGVVDMGRTRLHTVDATTGGIVRLHDLAGEITSAVPVAADRIVAASGAHVVEIDKAGTSRELARTNGVPYRLHAETGGSVVFTERHDQTGVVKRLSGKDVSEVARGPLTGMKVVAGTKGRVFLTGSPATVSGAITRVQAPVDAEVSTAGLRTTTHVPNTPGIEIQTRDETTGRTTKFSARLAAESPSDPVDQDRTCSVPRNDPRTQVYQPHWSQVEWAADLAVQGGLTLVRPANWKNSGIASSWRPQQMFEPVGLKGGKRVPAQIMLGILAQESNLWQASFHVAEGVTGNPLIGSYYGTRDGWSIDWAKSDCGYGVAQVTDGMRRPANGVPTTEQRAVAVDYATNIAAGLRILQQKWNQTYDLNAKVNGADASRIESWFTALWAYNSGINPQASTGGPTGCAPGPPSCTDPDGNYGLGWTNNPARPDYPPDRAPFLDHDSYDDARNPQWWPYPEKVIGWAAYPIVKTTGPDKWEAGYDQAWWNTEEYRSGAKPPLETFCSTHATDGNHCNPDNIYEGPNPCTRSDFHCWWHAPVQWKDCTRVDTSCGHESNTVTPPGTPEPPDADASGAYQDETRSRYLPNCSVDGLQGALVIDNLPDNVPSLRPGCGHPWTNAGSFALNFARHSDGLYHSKVDMHQIGGGFGGHFWFTHSQPPATATAKSLEVTGTWTLNRQVNGWARVLVHMPDHGAHTQQAAYTVNLGNGQTKSRSVLQKTKSNKWVSLGAFQFAGTPKVSLTNVSSTADGTEDVAYDAVAFQLLPNKPQQIVALGDSYSSGEGASQDARVDYYRETDDPGTGGSKYRNGCHRSRHALTRQVVLPGTTTTVGSRMDGLDPTLDYQLLACSGAQTENLLPSTVSNSFGEPGAGQHRELSQLDRGFLDENTTLVPLTIGGNDAHFKDVMQMCTVETPHPLENCAALGFGWHDWFGHPKPPDVNILADALPVVIKGNVKNSVEIAVRQVQSRAPNAKIVLMGYPHLFPVVGDGSTWHRSVTCMATLLLTDSEIDFMNNMSDLLNDVLHDLAVSLSDNGVPITYSDPRDEFELENVCSGNETIHRVVVAKTGGEAPGIGPSQQSFHPTIAGARNYADALTNTLRGTAQQPPNKTVAAAELYELKDYSAGSQTGYDRNLFKHWTKVLGSCDTRSTVLRRDGTNVNAGCPVTTGRWTSPYDNTVHTVASGLDIDHVVPLANAWKSGASKWTAERRQTLANDTEHPQLVAVSQSSNRSKGEQPPDVWLPAVSYLCDYARSWIHTKRMYHLSVTESEHATLKEILNTRC